MYDFSNWMIKASEGTWFFLLELGLFSYQGVFYVEGDGAS
jgi:hypothetical protein